MPVFDYLAKQDKWRRKIIPEMEKGGSFNKVLGLLIKYSIRTSDPFGLEKRTLLHEAAKYGRIDMLTMCLQYRPHNYVNDVKDRNGVTALMIAAKHGQAEAARFLLDRGADVEQADHAQRTALSYAQRAASPHVFRLLLTELSRKHGGLDVGNQYCRSHSCSPYNSSFLPSICHKPTHTFRKMTF